MGLNAGRRGARWEKLKANLRLQHRPCCRCGQPIDYTLRYPHPDSYSVDHYPHPLSTHPHLAEEPTNLAAAHLHCNQEAGGRPRNPGLPLGMTSRDW